MPEKYYDWREASYEALIDDLVSQGFVPDYAEELVKDVFTLVDRAYEYGVRDA